MRKNIVIIGVGNLGVRYLQGLSACKTPLNIYICDPSSSAIKAAKDGWKEVALDNTIHTLENRSHDEIPSIIDLAIISTNADIRPSVISNLKSTREVKGWIIEKNIAQSEEGLDFIGYCTNYTSHVYVNLPRCIMPWYREIKYKLTVGGRKNLIIAGGRWGLACNSIHHLHLAMFFTGETLVSINIKGSQGGSWYETKRKGYYDFFGTIEAEFSGGSTCILRCTDDNEEFVIMIKDTNQSVFINESRGVANFVCGETVLGMLQYQSQITASIVDSILSGNGCGLPTLKDVNEMQRILLRALRRHWNRTFEVNQKIIPVA